MDIQLQTLFNIGQEVKMKPLDMIGKIEGIYIREINDYSYYIRYWKGNEKTYEYFDPDEIEAIE